MLPSNFVSGDWLIREGDDHEYTRNSIVMNEVSVGTAVVPFTIPSGTILDATGGAVGTLPNAISGILLRDLYVYAGMPIAKVAVLRPGSHSIINPNSMPLIPVTGDAPLVVGTPTTAGSLAKALVDSGYFVRLEPPQVTIQNP